MTDFPAILVLIIYLVIYFIPSFAASKRKHKSAGAIFLTNLFFGWTIIGWIIAFIWAFTGNIHDK